MSDFGKLNFSVSFNPTSAFPLDARCYFESLSQAQAAAATAEEAGSTNTVYYIGQKLLVVADGEATWYTIQPDKTLLADGTGNSGSGEPGQDGFSPEVSVEEITGGHRVTITDADGTENFDVMDGQDGADGYTPVKGKDYFDGQDGKDGYTPIKGKDYFDGQDGYTPRKGVDYFDGEPGKDGKDGATPVFSIGTVETLEPGTNASASITGTAENPVLNLGIPKGMPGEGGSGGGDAAGAAIIDVTELPTENINEDVFYRLMTTSFLYGQFIKNDWTMYTVETLPQTGEMCWDGTTAVAYYSVSDNDTFGYVDTNVSAAMGVPVGWYPASVLIPAVGKPYGGVITDLTQAAEGTVYTFLQNVLHSYKDGVWSKIDVIGWRGTGESAEVFNHLSNVASGGCSHAEGYKTIASSFSQHVQGNRNIEDPNGIYAHIVGNGRLIGTGDGDGDIERRSNAHTLDWDGNAWFAGDVYIGGTGQDDPTAKKLQKAITGTAGQFVVIGEDGNVTTMSLTNVAEVGA